MRSEVKVDKTIYEPQNIYLAMNCGKRGSTQKEEYKENDKPPGLDEENQ